MDSDIIIRSALFTLRPWRMEDVASLSHHANNALISSNMRDMFPHPYTIEDAMRFIEVASEKYSDRCFAIEIEGQAVGGVGFVQGTDIERISAEVGYWLSEDYWGRGIMAGVVKAISQHVFANTEIIRLFAGVFAHNSPSMRVLEKTGFKHLTTMHRAAIKNGQVIDMEYYELLKPM